MIQPHPYPLSISRVKLYALLLVGCMVGYCWLLASFYYTAATADGPTVCLFKLATHLPCPSCGSTRAVMALLHGNIVEALAWNPLGILLLIMLIAVPLWIAYDLVRHTNTLQQAYHLFESMLRHRWIAATLILLMAANWIWNIYKGL